VELAERDARVLAELHHPHLPAYVDHFEHDGALYLAMEKIDGENLNDLKKRGGRLSENDVKRLLADAAEMLDYLHHRAPPVIHRDLKPANVIRRPDGSFAFVDFGAVRDKLREKGGSTVVGTFGFMAPEQFQGRALPATDVYAIGATSILLLTGTEPEDLPHKGLGIDVAKALEGVRVSRGLVQVLTQMLNPDPDQRASAIRPLLPLLAEPQKQAQTSNAQSDASARAPSEPPPIDRGARPDPPTFDPRMWSPNRDERREAKRQYKAKMRQWRHDFRMWARQSHDEGHKHHWMPGKPLPFPISVVVTLAMVAAIVATTLALQVFVPALLAILSIFFGAPLRQAATAVHRAGKHTQASLSTALNYMVRGVPADESAQDEGAESSSEPVPRTRVVADDRVPIDVETVDDPKRQERWRNHS
jgi:serine/threonine protein kinase